MFVLDDLILAEAAAGGAEALGAAEIAGGAEAAGAGLTAAEAAGLGAAGAGAEAGIAGLGIPPAALGPQAGLGLAQVGSAPVADAIAQYGVDAATKSGLTAAELDAATQGAIEYPGSGIGPSIGEYASITPTTVTDAVAPGPAPSVDYGPASRPVDVDYGPASSPSDQYRYLTEDLSTAKAATPTESSFFDKAMDWAKKNPGLALTGGILAANALGGRGGRGPAGYTPGILDKYRLSPNFQGRFANPQDFQYTPRYPRYAEGGIASYNEPNPMRNPYETGNAATYPQAAIPQSEYTTGLQEPRARNTTPDTFFTNAEGMADGGSTSALLSTYERMMRRAPSHAPAPEGGVGIYTDNDPDTRNLDAYRAAQVRLAKTAKRANVAQPAMQKTAGLGSLSMGPAGAKKDEGPQFQEAAQGGIMGASHLGGYAAGGNPRLLKGPGDGMSDDIPATINGRQPARLADGEFVIPADVVSHLGNGSTDAGAEKLHHMMDKVRKARTGNPKQGKQINPDKFIPK